MNCLRLTQQQTAQLHSSNKWSEIENRIAVSKATKTNKNLSASRSFLFYDNTLCIPNSLFDVHHPAKAFSFLCNCKPLALLKSFPEFFVWASSGNNEFTAIMQLKLQTMIEDIIDIDHLSHHIGKTSGQSWRRKLDAKFKRGYNIWKLSKTPKFKSYRRHQSLKVIYKIYIDNKSYRRHQSLSFRNIANSPVLHAMLRFDALSATAVTT